MNRPDGAPLTRLDEIVGPESFMFGVDVTDQKAVFDAATAGILRHLARTNPENPLHCELAARVAEQIVLRDPYDTEIPERFFMPDEYVPSAKIETLQQVYENYETKLENDFAQQFLNGAVNLEDYPLYERFTRLIDKEIELAKIRPGDRVLFIGSGPFPITAILLNRMAGVTVVCHDINPSACEVSRAVIEKLGVASDIDVIDVSGPERQKPEGKYDYDVTLVALLAQPKGTILRNIAAFGGKNSRVLLREAEGNRHLFYTGTSGQVVLQEVGAVIKGAQHAGKDDTISTLLLDISGFDQAA